MKPRARSTPPSSEKEVLEQVLRIVVRELEMAGAAFPGTGLGLWRRPGRSAGGATPVLRGRCHDRSGANAWPSWWSRRPTAARSPSTKPTFIEGLALQAAVALENARNHKRNVEFARVQQDMDAARAIQRSLLPHKLPSIPGYSLAFRSDTCYEVGGDYLDIVEQPDGSLLMAVADVAGKGLASAIMSTSFRSAFRGMAVPGPPLGDLATRMNQHHWARGRRGPPPLRDRHLPPAPSGDGRDRSGQCRTQSRLSAVAGTPSRRQFEAAGTPLGLLPGMQLYRRALRVHARSAPALLYRRPHRGLPGG